MTIIMMQWSADVYDNILRGYIIIPLMLIRA